MLAARPLLVLARCQHVASHSATETNTKRHLHRFLYKTPKATTMRPQSLLLANRLRPQSHPHATLMRPSCDPKAPPKPPQGHPKATLKPDTGQMLSCAPRQKGILVHVDSCQPCPSFRNPLGRARVPASPDFLHASASRLRGKLILTGANHHHCGAAFPS